MVALPQSLQRPQQSDPHADERSLVLLAAREWLATPFLDCASVRGAGVDCAMLIKAAYEGAGVESPIAMERYSPQWFLHGDRELWLQTVLDRGIEIEQSQAKPADLVLFKFGRFFAHGALIAEKGFPHIIHAFRQAGCVVEDDASQGFLRDRVKRFFTRKAWGA